MKKLAFFIVFVLAVSIFAYPIVAAQANGQPFQQLQRAIDEGDAALQEQLNSEASQRAAADNAMQNQIDSFFDIFTQVSGLYGVDSFFDVFVEINNRLTDLQNQINNIELIPGPQGEKGDPGEQGPEGTCSCPITMEMYNNLLARVEALESGCTPSTELCDGLDNDCDGQVDEGNPGGGQSCNTGLIGVCSAGTTQCSSGSLMCVQNIQASAETCDGLDNDCDGSTDEGNPGGGQSCNTGLPGVCSAGTTHCQSGSLMCVQNVQASPEICNGLDDDCDGQVDEGSLCSPYMCVSGMCTTSCASNSQCSPGYYCSGGFCVPLKVNGNTCAAGSECVSGYCSDGYCCNSACSGACDTCAQALGATMDGTCTILPAGSLGSPSCAPYVCNGASGFCPTSCLFNSDCSAGFLCSPSSLCVLQSSCEPTTEICDGLDNDCDDQIDEGFDFGTDENNCGGCGNACAAGYSCCSGSCSDNSADPDNCGGCGMACSSNNVAARTCTSGTCTSTCNMGFGDCNGNKRTDGCELNLLTNANNCGACGTPCSSVNVVSPTCTSGTCTSACIAGYGDCNGDRRIDGCEASLSTLTNCGACNTPCSLPNAVASCSTGTCALSSCYAGYSNCDGINSNGCEVSHNTYSNNCAGAEYVGSACGDESCGFLCPDSSWQTAATRAGRGSRWFKFNVQECSTCTADVYSRFTLDVPASTDYDLYVYSNCGALIGSSTSGTGQTEQLSVFIMDDGLGQDNSYDVWVEVRHISGASCSNWSLAFEGRNCSP